MKLFLSLALCASLLGTAATADPSDAVPGPRPGTVEAVQCLVGEGSPTCGEVFQGRARVEAKNWVFHDPKRNFRRGALVSNNFRRRASDGQGCDAMILNRQSRKEMDIFDVKFAYVGYTFYVAAPDPDGKIRALSVSPFPHDNQLCDR